MPDHLEVLLSPAEFEALPSRALGAATCVVFDILRATTSMIQALANGASAILPTADIASAVERRRLDPSVLLAGEREGVRILAAQAGGVDFDLGNSPREFTAERVRGRTLVMTTTNGTRALRACAGAGRVLVASFLNLEATARHIESGPHGELLLVCAGTHEEAALEDTLAAGALCARLWAGLSEEAATDSAWMAREIYAGSAGSLVGALGRSRNGRRLLRLPALAADVAFAAQRDTVDFTAALDRDGFIRRQG